MYTNHVINIVRMSLVASVVHLMSSSGYMADLLLCRVALPSL